MGLSNISDIKIKCTQIEYDNLSDELKNEIAYSKNVYVFYKDLVDLNCWTFSASSNKVFCTSYYKGVTNVDLGGEVIILGENLSDIYIPFQALFSTFNVPYNIEKDIIEVYNPVYTPSDFLHMERLNYYRYDVTSDDITSGKIGMFVDCMGDGLSIISDFSIHKIPDFVGEVSGKIPNEKSCEELTKILCQVDEMEKSKLLEYADVSLNSFLPLISKVSEELIKEGISKGNKDIDDFFELLTDYCNNNPTINVNGNEIESKYLLNFVLNTEIGDKYVQAVKSGDISESVNNVFSISGKILEKYISWASVSQTATNENIVNAVHTYCENFITTGELSNPTKFKNYILDYTFYDDKELVYDVKAVPLEFIDKDMILNGNNAPHKRGLSNQIVKYINENSDKYIDEEKQKEYGYKLFIDGIVELFKDKSFDKITDLKILKNIKAIKNTTNMKSAFGKLNAEWNIMKLFSNEANGTFDFYEANKMLLYANGLEQDTTNAVKVIKSNLSFNNYTNQIGNEDKQIPESKYWEDYCDLEYVRLKSYYTAHSLVKAKNEQYVKLMSSLREQELHSYTDDVPKYVRINSEEEYNKKMNLYNSFVERENLLLDELSNYMVLVLNTKQNLEKVKSTNYSKEADAELIHICCQKVTGKVKDSNGKAIDDVVVNFKNGTDTYFVKSNEFSLYLKAGDYEVSVSDDRYEEYTSKISLDKFGAISIDIVLTTLETNYTWHLDPTIPEEANAYNGHSYMVYPESMTWKEAKEYCEKLGGHLVTISDADEQKFVEDLAEKFTDKTSYWLGGYYSDLEWKWVDGTHFSYTNWDSWTDGTEEYKQPDNHTGNEFYLRFANKKIQYSTWYSNKGKWNDVSNEADGSSGDVPLNSFGFICEWDSIAEISEDNNLLDNISSWSTEQIINSVNAYLKEKWCGENQYYCFESDLSDNGIYWFVCIRWNGSNSANAMCGSDIKIDKLTGKAEISFLNEPYEWFNVQNYH